MDPTTTFTQFLAETDPAERAALATALVAWLGSGGFEPDHPDWGAKGRHQLHAAMAYSTWLDDGANDVSILHLPTDVGFVLIEHGDAYGDGQVGFFAALVDYSADGGVTDEHEIDGVYATFDEAFEAAYTEVARRTGILDAAEAEIAEAFAAAEANGDDDEYEMAVDL